MNETQENPVFKCFEVFAKRGLKKMKYILANKETEPGFKFLVKLNKADAGYFLYNNAEEAMEKARVLSLSEYPISLIYEPVKNGYGEWVMRKTFLYISGKPTFNDNAKSELHAKFYLESGEWLNPDGT